jgi:hypothetical protein
MLVNMSSYGNVDLVQVHIEGQFVNGLRFENCDEHLKASSVRKRNRDR